MDPKNYLAGKFSLQGKTIVRWLALGFGEADPQIYDNSETISSTLEGKWDGDDLIYKPKLENYKKKQIWEKVRKMMRNARISEDSFSDLGSPASL